MVETLNQLSSKQSMRKYVVNRAFTIGQIDVPVEEGDVLYYTRGKLNIYGQEYKVTNLEFALKANWISLAEGEEPDPVTERIIRGRNSTEQAEKVVEVTAPAEESNSPVEMVNGVETLPEGWETLHWTKKRAYLITMTDTDLLNDICADESDKIQAIIKKRLQELGESSKAESRLSMTGTNTGTPEKTKKLKPALAEDTFVETSFGPTTKKAIKISSESFDKTVVSSSEHDTEVHSIT